MKSSYNCQEQTESKRTTRIYRITIWGGIANGLLIILKFMAGIFGRSGAMIADAVHSLSDFLTDLVVLVFVRIAGKPRDEGHDYGHGKFETIATALIAITLIGVGVMLFVDGATKIYAHLIEGVKIPTPGYIALWMALASIVVKELLFRFTLRVGREVRSATVVANAWHHRSDAYSSIATLVGIGGAIILGPRWILLEPLAACLVSVFIIRVGVDLIRQAMNGLVEASLCAQQENEILEIIGAVKGVMRIANLRTREIGNAYAIEADIHVKGTLTVAEGHLITEHVEVTLKNKYGSHTHVVIHVEPAE